MVEIGLVAGTSVVVESEPTIVVASRGKERLGWVEADASDGT